MSDQIVRGPLLKTVTLGCKVNQYETEYVRQGLHRAGYVDAQPQESAQLCIVNTCTVTAEGDAKSRQVIRRMARENPASRIVVMGCYATRAPAEVAALPGVAEVITDKRELPDLLGRFGVIDVPTGISSFSGRRRAYVKIQDGCMLRCSYCIIPMVRPLLTSRPLPEIVDEVDRLVAAGYREIILTGIHLGHYGVDWNRSKPKDQWIRLAHVVDHLALRDGEYRLRLSSIEATEVTRELIAVLASHRDRVAPHLHLCLQSGSDRILRRMRRRWGVRMFLDRCRMLREALPEPALSTDVIVGFPGESEADFEATLETCRAAGFAKIHAFPFSPRRGTAAAQMPDPVPPEVIAARVQRLLELDEQLRSEYCQTLIGKELTIIVDAQRGRDESESARFARPDEEGWYHLEGISCRSLPVVARTPAIPDLKQLIRVRIDHSAGDRLTGTAIA